MTLDVSCFFVVVLNCGKTCTMYCFTIVALQIVDNSVTVHFHSYSLSQWVMFSPSTLMYIRNSGCFFSVYKMYGRNHQYALSDGCPSGFKLEFASLLHGS